MFWPVVAHAQFSADYQPNIIDGVVSNWSGNYIVGSNTVANLLVVANGGALTSTVGHIGYEASATNDGAIITGSNSTWACSQSLTVNRGALDIQNGARAQVGSFAIGFDTGANGTVWVNNGTLTASSGYSRIGYRGSGDLVVSNGSVNIPALYIAGKAGSAGTIHVHGGSLTVSSSMIFGEEPGPTGQVWITGGQFVFSGSELHVGNWCDGMMTISNSSFQTAFLRIGNGNVGTVTVAGGVLTNFSTSLGDTTNAALWITGGEFVNYAISVGAGADSQMIVSNGTVETKQLLVGWRMGGAGTLTIAGGSVKDLGHLYVAGRAGVTGTVWMSGGELNIISNLHVAGASDAELYGADGPRLGQFVVTNGIVLARDILVGTYMKENGILTEAGGTS